MTRICMFVLCVHLIPTAFAARVKSFKDTRVAIKLSEKEKFRLRNAKKALIFNPKSKKIHEGKILKFVKNIAVIDFGEQAPKLSKGQRIKIKANNFF